MAALKRTVDCSRRMVIYAIFDVLDGMNGEYEQEMPGDIRARIRVLDNTSVFALAVTGEGNKSSILHISMLCPAPELTERGAGAAVAYLMDSIIEHIENVKKSAENK